jgi:hypothetical protein
LLRFIVFSDMSPLLVKAKSKQLQVAHADHQWVTSADSGSTMHQVLSALPPDLRAARPGYAFSLAVWKVTGRRYLLCGLLRVFNDFASVLGPLCLRGLVAAMAPV